MNRDVNIKLRVIFAPCLSSWIVLLLFVLILYMVCSGRIHFQKQSLSSPFPDCNILCFFFLTLFSNRMPIVHFFFAFLGVVVLKIRVLFCCCQLVLGWFFQANVVLVWY